MDHHCPWFNTCVGYKNHAHFILFLVWLWIMCIFFLFMSPLPVLRVMIFGVCNYTHSSTPCIGCRASSGPSMFMPDSLPPAYLPPLLPSSPPSSLHPVIPSSPHLLPLSSPLLPFLLPFPPPPHTANHPSPARLSVSCAHDCLLFRDSGRAAESFEDTPHGLRACRLGSHGNVSLPRLEYVSFNE